MTETAVNGSGPAALDAVQAEVAAEQGPADDGSIVVTLRTDFGEAPVRVPPMNRWRSTARHALMTQKDDLTWATRTLSPQDAMQWMRLDPTQDDVDRFFEGWGRAVGVELGKAAASRTSSNGTPRS